MDSVTHIVIGAAIGEVMLGKKIGRKAAAIGALAKTIPDFDLFYTGLKDPFMYMCHHRGHTHSLIWESLYSLPLAYLFFMIFKKKISFQRWLALFLICLWGHSLLDVCTNYGTRLLLPFSNHPFSTNNIAIADLFFTIPMLVMLIIGLCYHKLNPTRMKWMKSTLIYCVVYLCMTFGNKIYANHIFEKSLKDSKINYTQSMTNPTIFNNFLWYGIATNDSTLYITENSLLNPKKNLSWMNYDRQKSILETYPNEEFRKNLQWFSTGYDISRKYGDTTDVFCVKFGRTNMSESDLYKSFVFHYQMYPDSTGNDKMTMVEPEMNWEIFKMGIKDLYERIKGK